MAKKRRGFARRWRDTTIKLFRELRYRGWSYGDIAIATGHTRQWIHWVLSREKE